MEKAKYILAILANYIPVLWAYIFYSIGAGIDWSLFIISQILLVTLNHKITKSKLALLFLHANLLVSTIVANWLSTHLYYTNISSDDETVSGKSGVEGRSSICYPDVHILLIDKDLFREAKRDD